MNPDDVLKTLKSLSQLGTQVSIDDICASLANLYSRNVFFDEVSAILDKYVEGGCVRKISERTYISLV